MTGVDPVHLPAPFVEGSDITFQLVWIGDWIIDRRSIVVSS